MIFLYRDKSETLQNCIKINFKGHDIYKTEL